MRTEENTKMFNDIARRYDLLNDILSLGMGHSWRRKLVKLAEGDSSSAVLDIATGTGDQIIAFFKKPPYPQKSVGLDPASEMLDVARVKIENAGLAQDNIELCQGSVMDLQFENESFDIASCSFGVRNFEDRKKGFAEIFRILKSNGRFLFLEFSLPKDVFRKTLVLLYLRIVLPLMGGVLAGNSKAYHYLNKSIEEFPQPEALIDELKQAGFAGFAVHSMCLGVVKLFVVKKEKEKV